MAIAGGSACLGLEVVGLGVFKRAPVTWRNVVLLTAGAASVAACWFKLNDYIPQDKNVDIPLGTIFGAAGALVGGLTLASVNEIIEALRSRRIPDEQTLPMIDADDRE
jgi:hypothetical protein